MKIEYSLKWGLISEADKAVMELPCNRVEAKSYGKNSQNSKSEAVCNNKNRCKTNHRHRDIIDFYQYIGTCNV